MQWSSRLIQMMNMNLHVTCRSFPNFIRFFKIIFVFAEQFGKNSFTFPSLNRIKCITIYICFTTTSEPTCLIMILYSCLKSSFATSEPISLLSLRMMSWIYSALVEGRNQFKIFFFRYEGFRLYFSSVLIRTKTQSERKGLSHYRWWGTSLTMRCEGIARRILCLVL